MDITSFPLRSVDEIGMDLVNTNFYCEFIDYGSYFIIKKLILEDGKFNKQVKISIQ